uniref:Uncharacterized protein n=1 Tax=Nelumbo nucifera TaxID=4432 RepID=A0A822YVV8_NELNU|nr:TPA_asm: hypothetical protein HUJ06_006903 [Nelumbo nucifera]
MLRSEFPEFKRLEKSSASPRRLRGQAAAISAREFSFWFSGQKLQR